VVSAREKCGNTETEIWRDVNVNRDIWGGENSEQFGVCHDTSTGRMGDFFLKGKV
jgi:hypothetical protein